jgi:hypothetical protein
LYADLIVYARVGKMKGIALQYLDPGHLRCLFEPLALALMDLNRIEMIHLWA